MYPADLRRQAIELRLQGFTLREIGQKLDVNHQTVATWCGEQRSEASLARQQRIFDATQDLAIEARDHVAELLPKMGPRDAIATFTAATNANHGALRIIQDERKRNDLLNQLRDQLRAKSPAELKAIILDPDDHERDSG